MVKKLRFWGLKKTNYKYEEFIYERTRLHELQLSLSLSLSCFSTQSFIMFLFSLSLLLLIMTNNIIKLKFNLVPLIVKLVFFFLSIFNTYIKRGENGFLKKFTVMYIQKDLLN